MANKNLFEQAIADAKNLKAISMANAKQTIEEAFAPKIQEMFRLKLSEMEEKDNMEEGLEDEFRYIKGDQNRGHEGGGDIEQTDKVGSQKSNSSHEGDTFMEEATLEEILAELELEEDEENESKYMEEAKEDDEEEAEEAEEGEETEEGDDEEEGIEGSEKVTKLTVDKFQEMVRDIVADVLSNLNPEDTASEPEATEEPATDEEPKADAEAGAISLDEILAELEEEEAMKDEKVTMEDKEELMEATKTINYLKKQLSEINLLNAKLLYVNKIFKSKSLSESQKVKVITAFDRATTINETKNIYQTLNDSMTAAPQKAALKESYGFASKAIGKSPVKPIVEADAYVYRMQQLAGIKEPNI